MASGRDRLHRLVWQNDVDALRDLLASPEGKAELNKLDVRGNTPLHLAAMLNRKEAMQVLLEAGADILQRNRQGWFPDHEARSVGDREALLMLHRHKRTQLEKYFSERAGPLMAQLAELDDFYLEMRWDFSSWVPLVSHFCPSDTYRFQKKGSSLRVDTTLIGFENLKWQRGNISYLFYPDGKAGADFVMVDHDNKIFERISADRDDPSKVEERINFQMNTPIRVAAPLVDKVVFNAKKTGVLGFGVSKQEKVGEYDAEVYTIGNFRIKTFTRTEHLDPKLTPKDAPSTPSTPSRPSSRPPGPAGLDSPSGSAASLPSTVSGTADGGAAGEDASKDVLLDLLETPVDPDNPESQKKILAKLEGKQDSDVEALYKSTRARALKFRPTLLPPPPPPIDFQAYFSPELAAPSGAGGGSSSNLLLKQQAPPAVASPVAGEAPYIHVGRPIVQKEVTQSIKATLWMSTSFPLFVEQLFPILTIMSPTNEHFARLKEFIELKLPRGFPIKIEIPLFGVLTAKVTFQAYRIAPELDADLFKVPSDYAEGEVKFKGMS